MHLFVIANTESIHTQKILQYIFSQGHRVDVIGFDRGQIEGIQTHYIQTPRLLKSRKLKYLYSIYSTKKILKKTKPDILLSIYLIGPGGLGAACNFHPFVIMAMGSDVLLEMKKSLFHRIITKFTIQRADRFVSVAHHIADGLKKRGVLEENIFMNPIGIDTNLFALSEDESKGEKFQIVSTRELYPLYNVKQFADSLPIVSKKLSELNVVIIGNGIESKSIKSKIVKDGLEKKVKFTGRVTRAELISHLKQSHVFVSMALSDGAPVSLFEAMSCGCFPILSDIPANRAWIQDGKNGYLIPIGDHIRLAERIIDAANDLSFLKKARRINRQIVVDQLEFSLTMDNLIKYFDSILHKHE